MFLIFISWEFNIVESMLAMHAMSDTAIDLTSHGKADDTSDTDQFGDFSAFFAACRAQNMKNVVKPQPLQENTNQKNTVRGRGCFVLKH